MPAQATVFRRCTSTSGLGACGWSQPAPDRLRQSSRFHRVGNEANGFIADVLRSFAGERADDWPALEPLVHFAINDSASPLGTGYTPFYADRGPRPASPAAR